MKNGTVATSQHLFTSESVSPGHPDKVCDQISDAVVDHILQQIPNGRAAIETVVGPNRVIMLGECSEEVLNPKNFEHIARETAHLIGYDQPGFNHQDFAFDCYVHGQSTEIKKAVDRDLDDATSSEGAGDQGVMFGYACDETDAFMPAAIYYAHKVLEALSEYRKKTPEAGFLPDAKAQVTLEFKDSIPTRVHTLVVSTQHMRAIGQKDISLKHIQEHVLKAVVPVFPDGWVNIDENSTPKTKILINPSGSFIEGGPTADAGLTGRKIIVDTYGGSSPHGGGAFSGKDPTKVDRSAAYAARYIARNIVAAKLARWCTIQLSYAIGKPEPLSVYVNTNGSAKLPDHVLTRIVSEQLFDLTPRGIIQKLNLQRPIYTPTAVFGHFGRTPTDQGHFSWERDDLVDTLIALAHKG